MDSLKALNPLLTLKQSSSSSASLFRNQAYSLYNVTGTVKSDDVMGLNEMTLTKVVPQLRHLMSNTIFKHT